MRSPVAFIIFKRPELTRAVIERIAAARPPKLFIIADGPRLDRADEADKCAATRAVTERIDWKCEVIRDYASTNQGAWRRVAGGLTSAFQQVQELVVLEDDCVPDPTFFQFCDDLLERYRHDDRVMHIAGNHFQAQNRRSIPYSYSFACYPISWGWATWRRALCFASFLLSCVVRLAVLPRFDVVVALTSPPLISFLGALFVRLKGGRFVFWVMDLNPDEAVVAGWLRERSLVARTLQRMLRYSVNAAKHIVVLDRFMKQRIVDKGIAADKLVVVPPWAHDDAVCCDPSGRESFRERYGLTNKFVVMYSGNHSPGHPLDRLLQAAEIIAADRVIAFCFVAGGSEFKRVKEFSREGRLGNTLCLPYQPLNQLAESLSAADLHVVVMGDPFVGIIHPCKIYNILAVGLPYVIVGPPESHLSDIVNESPFDERAAIVPHGEPQVLARHLRELASCRSAANQPKPSPRAAHYSHAALIPRMIEVIESRGDFDAESNHLAEARAAT